MKIRVRLSLLFILCSTASLLVCGFLLLRTSARSIIQAAEDNAVSELTMLKTSFSSAAAKNLDAGASDTVRRSLLIYTFQSYADDTFSGSQYVLKRGEETLYKQRLRPGGPARGARAEHGDLAGGEALRRLD